MKVSGKRNPTATLSGDNIGPAISIALTQPPGSLVDWVLRIDAESDQGSYTVGRVRVRAPWLQGIANDEGPKGLDARQVVAYAFSPGALRWHIDARAVLPNNYVEPDVGPALNVEDATCELFIQSDPIASSLGEPGVVLINTDGRGPTYVPKQIPFVDAVGGDNPDQLLIANVPAYLWKVRGSIFIEPEPAPTSPWVLVFDHPGPLPVGLGDPIRWSIPTTADPTLPGTFYFAEDWPRGCYGRRGLVLVVSGGPAAYAAVGGFTSFVPSYEFETVPEWMAT